MDADLDTLATALYVRTDDLLKTARERVPWRPRGGIPRSSAMPSCSRWRCCRPCSGTSARHRWLRFARAHLRHLFPHLPQQPGYNKRLRQLAGTHALADHRSWPRDTSLVGTDDVWVSTPPRWNAAGPGNRPPLRLAGWAEYGYCASHSRYFWGLRLHLLPPCTACPWLRADRRQSRRTARLPDILAAIPTLAAARPGQC